MFIEVVKFVIGIGVMLYGADLLVTKAEKFGRARRWPQILVSVLVVRSERHFQNLLWVL